VFSLHATALARIPASALSVLLSIIFVLVVIIIVNYHYQRSRHFDLPLVKSSFIYFSFYSSIRFQCQHYLTHVFLSLFIRRIACIKNACLYSFIIIYYFLMYED
jgi:hypothetical protein